MAPSLIHNPPLSAPAALSLPCADHAPLEGHFPRGFLALVFQGAGQVRGSQWYESLFCSNFIGLAARADQCWQEIEAFIHSQRAINLQEAKLLLACDFVAGLVALSESEGPDENGRSMFGL